MVSNISQVDDGPTSPNRIRTRIIFCCHQLPLKHGLQKLCDYFRVKASVAQDSAMLNRLTVLKNEFIKPRMDLCSKSKSEKLAITDEEDYAWVKNMAPAGEAKRAVQEMMKDLATAAYAQKNAKPGNWKRYATVCQIGIFFMAQCNSRPGPWVHLTVDTIEDMKDKIKEFWTAIIGHKQLWVRGAHGCYLCPSSLKSAEVYLSMLGRTSNSFWLYKCIKLDVMLKEACAVYLPGFSEMTPSSMRTFWETTMHHDTGEIAERILKASEKMHNCQDHTRNAAWRNYIKGKAQKVAADCKACTTGYYDGLIEWPEDQLSPEFLESNACLLPHKFADCRDPLKRKFKEATDVEAMAKETIRAQSVLDDQNYEQKLKELEASRAEELAVAVAVHDSRIDAGMGTSSRRPKANEEDDAAEMERPTKKMRKAKPGGEGDDLALDKARMDSKHKDKAKSKAKGKAKAKPTRCLT